MSVAYCQHCRTTTNLLKCSSPRRLKSGEIRQYHICRACNTARCKKYRATSAGKLSVLKAVAKYERSHPERVRAWSVRQRVNTEPCIICGAVYTHRHHPNVNKTYEIVFLCPRHHKEAHREIDLKTVKISLDAV